MTAELVLQVLCWVLPVSPPCYGRRGVRFQVRGAASNGGQLQQELAGGENQ